MGMNLTVSPGVKKLETMKIQKKANATGGFLGPMTKRPSAPEPNGEHGKLRGGEPDKGWSDGKKLRQ